MLSPQSWLLLLATLSSHVSAFYPYHRSAATKDSTENEKRFFPIQVRPAAPASPESLIKADIIKVPKQRRDNQFVIVHSDAPTGGPNAVAIDQDGSDYSYFSQVKFGSKAQIMYMLIDTGSANTWVFSSECQSETCGIHNTFGKEDSTTLKTTTEPWDLTYGTGEVSGNVVSDAVAFGNFSINMSFGLAVNASDDFDNYPMDGILGLGRKSSDALGTPTVIDVLSTNKLIAKKMIGVHLHRAEDNAKDGEIIFGGVDTGKFSGNIAYTKTANDAAWEIAVDDMLVNGAPGNFTGRTAIIDTGTTFILMPPADAKAIHAMIPGAVASGETFNLPCNANAKLEVKINDKIYGISAKDYVGKPISTGSSTCSSTIIGHQAYGATQWILGDVFLKNVYSVFDFDNKQIGFAMPGSGGSEKPAASSSASASASATGSAASSTRSSASASASGSQQSSGSGVGDSNIGGETDTSSAVRGVVGYWKVGFSICLGLVFGMGVILI